MKGRVPFFVPLVEDLELRSPGNVYLHDVVVLGGLGVERDTVGLGRLLLKLFAQATDDLLGSFGSVVKHCSEIQQKNK